MVPVEIPRFYSVNVSPWQGGGRCRSCCPPPGRSSSRHSSRWADPSRSPASCPGSWSCSWDVTVVKVDRFAIMLMHFLFNCTWFPDQFHLSRCSRPAPCRQDFELNEHYKSYDYLPFWPSLRNLSKTVLFVWALLCMLNSENYLYFQNK